VKGEWNLCMKKVEKNGVVEIPFIEGFPGACCILYSPPPTSIHSARMLRAISHQADAQRGGEVADTKKQKKPTTHPNRSVAADAHVDALVVGSRVRRRATNGLYREYLVQHRASICLVSPTRCRADLHADPVWNLQKHTPPHLAVCCAHALVSCCFLRQTHADYSRTRLLYI
jgi:hypothetical protein